MCAHDAHRWNSRSKLVAANGLAAILILTLATGAFAQPALGVFGDAACTVTTINVPTNTAFSVWVAMKNVVTPAKGVAWSLTIPGLGTALVHTGTTFLGATLGGAYGIALGARAASARC